MANKKFIEQMSKRLSETTEKLIELQVRAHAGVGVGGGGLGTGGIGGIGGGGGVDSLIGGLSGDGATVGKNKARSAEAVRRDNVKRSLLAGLVEAADQFRNDDMNVFDRGSGKDHQGCARCLQLGCRWCNDHLPLTHDVRSIEARYGQNVASFFHFLRFVIFCFFALSMINLTTYVWHVTDILYANTTGNATHPLREAWHGVNISKSKQLHGGCEWNPTRRRTICTIEYGVIEESRWNIERTGWDWFKNFENIRSIAALPSAFGFSHRSDENSYSSFVFALNILVSTGVLALLVIIKLIREDRVFKVVHATSSGEQNEFTRLTLDAWDHGEFGCF
mgnify:CR=1 FL=1